MRQNFILFFVLVVIFLSCGAASPDASASSAEILIQDLSIIYRGTISRESNDRLFNLVETADPFPTALVITSKGGDTMAGMELGRWVFRHGLDVIVTELCLSSCANYVFPAGNKKILGANAVLAWHGGAMQEEWDAPCSGNFEILHQEGFSCADIENLFEEQLESFRREEKLFFAEIGVDQRVPVLGQEPEYRCSTNTDEGGWDYSIEDMGRLGIKNIQVRNGTWLPESMIEGRTICRVELGEEFQ